MTPTPQKVEKGAGETLALELPWPPKELTPNFKRRHHWSKYRKPTADYRAHCAWLAVHWLIQNRMSADKANLRPETITFHPPDNRRRDDDGMIGSFKAGRDGIADALGMDDNKFRPAYHFGDTVKGGRVVVSIG